MIGRNKLHDVTIDLLLERLTSTGKYGSIRREYWYDRNGLTGELDIYARRRNAHIYFEVKSTLCPSVLRKAQHQAFRAITAHPGAQWYCWLVLPPSGHPSAWINERRPRLRAQRIVPRCHHLPPAQVRRSEDAAFCSLCGDRFLPAAHRYDAAGRAQSDLVSAYSAYLSLHPRHRQG